MTKPLRFLPEAEDELRAASEWYDDRAELGDDLASEVLAATVRIAEAPESFPLASGVRESSGVQQAPVKRFPYRVAFIATEDEIRVVAVAHTRRRPGYWLDRLS